MSVSPTFYSTYGLFYFESGIAWFIILFCWWLLLTLDPQGRSAVGLANLKAMKKDCYAADLR